MAEHWVCKLCIARYGLRGCELEEWPLAGDEAAIAQHLRDKHGFVVVDGKAQKAEKNPR